MKKNMFVGAAIAAALMSTVGAASVASYIVLGNGGNLEAAVNAENSTK